MTLPAAPTSSAGEKLFYLTDDNAGTNRANVPLGINSTTLNSERVASMGVGTHKYSGGVNSGDAIVVVAGINTGLAKPLATDINGILLAAEGIVDNAAFTDGTSRLVPAGFILDEVAGTALSENDSGAARIDSKRAQVLVLEDATTRGRRALVTSIGELAVGSTVAHDAVFAGNPLPMGGYASTAIPSAVSADGDITRAWLTRTGAHMVRSLPAATATLSNVASSATSVTLLAANNARIGATIYNDSTQILYVKFGATASSTSYTVQLVAGAYFEVPFGYSGIIDGLWASANGNARVTEITQ